MDWIKPPYYVPDKANERVDAGPFFTGGVPTAEASMQSLVAFILSNVNGFLWGAGAGTGAETVAKFTDEFIGYARTLTPSGIDPRFSAFQDAASVAFNPDERGQFYANLVIETLKKIQASSVNPMFPSNLSVYDVWTKATQ